MLINNFPDAEKETQLGCARDMVRRLQQYNSQDPVEVRVGSTRRTRSAAGHWKILLVIVLPPNSDVDQQALLDVWNKKYRKVHKRFEFGIRVAAHLGLPVFVDTNLLTSDARLSRPLRQR